MNNDGLYLLLVLSLAGIITGYSILKVWPKVTAFIDQARGLFVGPGVGSDRGSDRRAYPASTPAIGVIPFPAPRIPEPVAGVPVQVQTSTSSTSTWISPEQLTKFHAAIKNGCPTWFKWLVFDPDAVHVLIVGAQNSGKSTLAYSVLACRAWAGGRILVLDPHANFNDWPVPAVGSGRDYGSIESSIQALLKELTRRYSLSKKDQIEELTIFIDEWPSIKDHCPSAVQFMKELAREGRKVKMRLCILTQSDLVESLGIKGEGDTRKNFAMFYLGGAAADRWPKDQVKVSRPGILDHDGCLVAVDLAAPFVLKLSRLPVENSVWEMPKDQTKDFDFDPGSLVPVPDKNQVAASFEVGTDGTSEPGTAEPDENIDPVKSEMDKIVIKSLAAAGYNRTKVAAYLGGRKQFRLDQIRKTLEGNS